MGRVEGVVRQRECFERLFIPHGCHIKNYCNCTNERDSFLLTLDAGAAFLSGKHPKPINDSEQGTLLHIGRLSKSEGQIDELLEKADDLLLES
jgi:hypothetical protein